MITGETPWIRLLPWVFFWKVKSERNKYTACCLVFVCCLCMFRPQEPNKDEFEQNSMRCGRKLSKDGDVSLGSLMFCFFIIGFFCLIFMYCVILAQRLKPILPVFQYCWRWTGFNFGFDLLVTYTNRFIVFKRNTLSQPCGGAVSLQPRRHLAYRWEKNLTNLIEPF